MYWLMPNEWWVSQGCSRVLFLVEGPPFRAAVAALMGMVQSVGPTANVSL